MNQQSPIDIAGYVEGAAPRLSFDYGGRDGGSKRLSNTGEFVKVHYQDAGGIRLGADAYRLVESHFHNPSEHTIDGRRYALETHLVHLRGESDIAVVGILYRIGAPNPLIEAIIETAPSRGEPDAPTTAFPPSAYLPAQRGSYAYPGSLTTPPYTEGVQWRVMSEILEVSADQVARLSALTGARQNSREIQPLNGRVVWGLGWGRGLP